MRLAACLIVLALLLAAPAGAKKYRYEGGPQPVPDTVYSVASGTLQPIVRSKGPRVPLTNLELTRLVAATAFDRALSGAPLDSGTRVVVAPGQSHPLNFMAEGAVLQHLARRGITSTVRRGVIPDDSLLAAAGVPANPVLEYQLATARVTYLRLIGWLPGRVKIERQGLVQGSLTLREPRTATVLWSAPADFNLVDAFPRSQLPLVEDQRFTDLKSAAPTRNVDKVVEPVVVVGVVVGLVALFFQNRP
jgi:hypothetical protein